MAINVKFFEGDIEKAIGAGIYGIYRLCGKEEKLLYIGESVFVMVRCSTHLYEISKGEKYLGFSKDVIENYDNTIIFRLLETEQDKEKRKAREVELIDRMKPIMQKQIKDWVKSVEEMDEEMAKLLIEK